MSKRTFRVSRESFFLKHEVESLNTTDTPSVALRRATKLKGEKGQKGGEARESQVQRRTNEIA